MNLIINGDSCVEVCVNHDFPSDKSISQRALLTAFLVSGKTEIKNINKSISVLALIDAFKTLGVAINSEGNDLTVEGWDKASLKDDTLPYLNLGISSAAARILIGVLAGLGVNAFVDGDVTLRPRPIDWVVDPINELGGNIEYLAGKGNLPVRIHSAPLHNGEVFLKVNSAQASSAIIYAAIAAGIDVNIHQVVLSRDHTNRLFNALGYHINYNGSFFNVAAAGKKLQPYPSHTIPVDPSGVSYFLTLHVLHNPDSIMRIDHVCLNPTRTGFFEFLRKYGFDIRYKNVKDVMGETVGTLAFYPSRPSPSNVLIDDIYTIQSMLDEIPLAAAVASVLEGEARFEQLHELKFKETDRIQTTKEMLKAFGMIDVISDDTSLNVSGGQKPQAGIIPSFGDHRICMSAAVLATLCEGTSNIKQGECVETSFPNFVNELVKFGVQATLNKYS